MRTALAAGAVFVLAAYPAAAQTNVDPAIHNLCIEAKDYAGCVKAMAGEMPASYESSYDLIDMADAFLMW